MRRLMLAAVLVAAGAVSGAQQPVFRSSVDLVVVDVLVSSRGTPVAGLRAADFEVRDNGVLQRLDSVTHEQVPLDVILVLDTSLSVEGEKLGHLRDAARGVLDTLRPGDQAALITFSERVVLRRDLTSDLSQLREAIDRTEAGGATAALDALYAALALRRSTRTRCLVLLFTDGLDNLSWLSRDDVLTAFQESDVVVYGVGLDEDEIGSFRPIAEEAGGELLLATSGRDLKALFVRIVREMQARYVLAYYPQGVKREGWHGLSVRLTKAPGDLRARRGYLVSAR